MKSVLTIMVLAGISAGVFALGSLRKESTGKALLHIAEEVALTVDVAKPQRGEIIHLVQAPGDVEAVLEVDVSSEIVAKIEEMPVQEGDTVKQGDLLCRLDDRFLRADVESGNARIAQLEAAMVQSNADLDKAVRDLARQVKLSENDATSDVELRDYQTKRDKARAVHEMRRQELIQAQAALKRIHENLARTIIRSPIDGVISRLRAKQGEVVVTGTMNNPGTVIMTISDLSQMQVRTRVDEVDVPLVRAGQTARVYLQSDQDNPVPARILRVAAKGSKPTGRDVVTFETILTVLSNEERIKPGMTANVEIEVARKTDVITVPVEAVVHRMRKELPESVVEAFDKSQAGIDMSARARQAQYIKVVYVMDDDVAHVRVIEPGIADTRRVELLSGVELGDTVIVGPYRSLDQLKDGTKVALAEDKKDKKKTPTNADDEAKVAVRFSP
ncbi:MAG: efflux RND transporter periplasmic adaptor subunit [Planctomycetes bacterium]|nr:efflux RND transporter periplasmic adaptor subunit [Planctomycetota bacterium]